MLCPNNVDNVPAAYGLGFSDIAADRLLHRGIAQLFVGHAVRLATVFQRAADDFLVAFTVYYHRAIWELAVIAARK